MRRVLVLTSMMIGALLGLTTSLLAAIRFPDMQPVMYFQMSDTTNVYRMNADGKELELLLTNFADYEGDIQWAPHHQAWGVIALENDYYTHSTRSLYRMRPNGQQLRSIPHTEAVNEFAWSDDGQWILFATSSHVSLQRIQVDGGQYSESLNPSLTAIAELHSLQNHLFMVRATHEQMGNGTYIIRLDGSVVGRAPRTDPNRERVLSSSDKWIAFSSGLPNKHDIFRIKNGGFSAVRLTQMVGDERFVAWSADGDWIVFTHQHPSGKKDFYRVRWDGIDLEQLTHSLSVQNVQALSPDKQWVFFDTHTAVGISLYRMRLDGSDLKEVAAGFDNPPMFQTWLPNIERQFWWPLLLVLSTILIGGGICASYSFSRP